MYIIYILNMHNFSHNVHNYIYSNKYNFSKNFHNSVYLMYKIFLRIYTILHIQRTQFFKEYSIYLIIKLCIFDVYNFSKNVHNFVYSTCTIFQCMNIFIHKLLRVRSVYLLSKPSKDVYNFTNYV